MSRKKKEPADLPSTEVSQQPTVNIDLDGVSFLTYLDFTAPKTSTHRRDAEREADPKVMQRDVRKTANKLRTMLQTEEPHLRFDNLMGRYYDVATVVFSRPAEDQ